MAGPFLRSAGKQLSNETSAACGVLGKRFGEEWAVTRVKLIEPGNARDDPFAQCWYSPQKRRFAVPLLALPVVAAMCPRDWDVEIIDEKLHDIDFDADCDLVAMSFKTKDARRAYRYAAEFRRRGVPVILGGVHVSNLPDEAAAHADSVVVGEAEGVWPRVVEDFRHGRLQQVYRAPPPREVSLEAAPVPRFDLIDNDRYCLHAVQTSRGCLVGCEFCPVQKMFGGVSRHKSVARVLAEVDTVRRIDPDKDVFFVDEMFCGGDLAFQSELLAGLRRKKVNFVCITDFKVITPAYVRELARSGCRKMSINMPGTCLPQELKAVRAIQRLGIDVWGFFMFGFSFHDATVFDRVARFVCDSGMKHLTLTVMTPFPNTPADCRVRARNAHLTTDWDQYDQCHVTFEPEKMSAQELRDGFRHVWATLEQKLYFSEDAFTGRDRLRRRWRRTWGTLTLGVQHLAERLGGHRPAPVNLEGLVGKPKVEVSITTRDIMGAAAQ